MSEPSTGRKRNFFTIAILTVINSILPDWLAGKIIEYLRLSSDQKQEPSPAKTPQALKRDLRERIAQRLITISYAFVFATFAPFFLSRFASTVGFVLFLYLPGLFEDLKGASDKLAYIKSPFAISELLSVSFLFIWMSHYQKYPLQVALEALQGEAYAFPIFLILFPIIGVFAFRPRKE